jgi:type IV pilus assembly protein PilE
MCNGYNIIKPEHHQLISVRQQYTVKYIMIMRKKSKGFTLIELMVAVAIVGILAGIAYPSYISNLTKSRRADATGALLGFASAMERHFTEKNTYCDAGGTGGADTCGVAADAINDNGSPSIYSTQSPTNGGTKYYDLTINSATAGTYTLRATPISPGAQAGNGFLQITNTGTRSWDKNNDGDTSDAGEDNWD